MVRYIILLLLSILFITCNRQKNNDKTVKQSLALAGNNRYELEKVIDHYKNDYLKLNAAKFLISNMPGAFARNKGIIDICTPFYNIYDSLAKEYDYLMNAERGRKIDSLWNSFYVKHAKLERLSVQTDLENLSAEQLIAEIELAFKAWERNVYTRDCTFDEFCEYILPYRRMNGLVIDDARINFYKRHHGDYFTQPGKDMVDETDSLLYEYRHLTHSQFWGSRIPILTASTFDHLRHGLCEHRCWYNSLFLSSLGMATAVDLAPAWGNRNSSHTWNVLIRNGKSYAFEANWDDDRWKYKRIYNNKTFDHLWGKFRLPKIYRHSFKNYTNGPVSDKKNKPEDIPPLFRNIKLKDVSSEYFETTDITLSLENILPEAHYAYLCVFGYQQWHPVQWSKINGGEVTFAGMGKDIVYLPAYYKDNQLIPAGEPFLWDSTGNKVVLYGNGKKLSVSIHHVVGAACHSHNRSNIQLLHELTMIGYSQDNNSSDTLLVLPDTIPLESVLYPIQGNMSYNRIAAYFSSDTTAVSEITFFDTRNRIVTPDFVEADIIPFNKNDSLSYVSDLIMASGINGINKERKILFHLMDNTNINSVRVSPYTKNIVENDGPFTLYYWDKGWKEVDTQQTSKSFLTFQNVPDNRLYMLRNQRWAKKNSQTHERIFLYKNGEVLWY